MKYLLLLLCFFLPLKPYSSYFKRQILFTSKESIYIEKHKDCATEEMKLFKIPVSVILGQALLESSAGTSELALNANNHFAIKCKKDWKGLIYYYSDDNVKECFRRYSSVNQSYRDHSLFLINNKRYEFLLKLSIYDYKNWCKGLQKAGYATDSLYAEKLINKIESNKLYLLDYQ